VRRGSGAGAADTGATNATFGNRYSPCIACEATSLDFGIGSAASYKMRRPFAFLSFGLLAFCSILGCSSAKENGGTALYLPCRENSDCQSGICVHHYPKSSSAYDELTYCSKRCDGGCPSALTCGTVADGSQACVEPCSSPDEGIKGSYGCRDNVPIACDAADPTYCTDCGCPDATERCEPGVGCQPKRQVGEVCRDNSDCKSDNCSTYLGVCRVPVFSQCDANNCDRCVTDTVNGSIYCTRSCNGDTDCNGGYCLGYGYDGSYVCQRPCSACTSDTCNQTNSGSTRFCDCPSCVEKSAPRPLGTRCENSGQCSSGVCYATYYLDKDSLGHPQVIPERTLCTKSCYADLDCGESGLVCALLPCHGDDGSMCGALCLHPCDADGSCSSVGGRCRSLPKPTGETATVCDFRDEVGAHCECNEECLSGRCTNAQCVGTLGAANGTSCKQISDCQSASCVNGTCKGTSLVGDPCTVSADCAVGTCCSSNSKCATGC
jgi:hypothetical protein